MFVHKWIKLTIRVFISIIRNHLIEKYSIQEENYEKDSWDAY